MSRGMGDRGEEVIYSFKKYLLSTCSMPGQVLGSGGYSLPSWNSHTSGEADKSQIK